MEINITLKISEGHYGHSYRALSAKDADGNQLAVDIAGKAVVDFVEYAIQQGIAKILANGGNAEAFTVNMPAEIVLSAGLQTHLSDKYSADPVVSSLAFA